MGKPPGEVATRHLISYFPMHVLPAHTSAAAHPERGLALVAVCYCMLPAWALALWLFPCFTSTRIANGTRIYFYLAFESARARVYV